VCVCVCACVCVCVRVCACVHVYVCVQRECAVCISIAHPILVTSADKKACTTHGNVSLP
jgi:hypothetical protein